MSDLITSLRALAAARHDDLSIAVDAVIEIERQRAEIERLTRERDEARAEIENLYDQIHRWVDDRAKAQSQADRLREQNYELQRERDEARAWAAKLLATLEMARDADNDCRVEGWATIPDAVRRSIDEALEAKP